MTAEKFDVYSHVTNQIIAQIEAGTPPWRKPWTGGGVSVSLPERFKRRSLSGHQHPDALGHGDGQGL